MHGKLFDLETKLKSPSENQNQNQGQNQNQNQVSEILKSIDKVFKDAETGKPFLGWMRLPHEDLAMKEVSRWLKTVKKNQTTLCVFGIGGSCLGAKAVYDFLQPEKSVLFFDNIDGHSFEARLAKIKLKTAHFLLISKSGETSETLFQTAHLFDLLTRQKLKIFDHVTIITEKKDSTLTRIGNEFGLQSLSVPLDVGGRFSVFSQVGLAPLMWAGVPVKKMLKGAELIKSDRELIAKAAGFYLNSFRNNESISIFWFYVENLRTFGLWLQQLWAESLGKSKDRSGLKASLASTPLSCIGATDQHSLLQQFTEGARDKSFLFVRCAESEKSSKIKKIISKELSLAKGRSVGELLGIEASATQKIVESLGISTACLKFENIDAQNLGALLFLFQILVATLGEVLNLNAFDQPGVEGVKKVTLGTLGDLRFKDHAL
jgi:glucose-6-phosphate isomerase